MSTPPAFAEFGTLAGDDFIRTCELVEVIDGDTCRLFLSNGFGNYTKLLCRLNGLNAIEKNDPGGAEARDYLTHLLALGPLEVTSVGYDKYAGRFDGMIRTQTKWGRRWVVVDVNAAMIAAGYAAPWDGRGDKPVPPWPVAAGEHTRISLDPTG